jgi:ribosomal protein L13
MSTTPELNRHIEQIVNSMIPRFKRRCKQLIESFNGYNNKKYIDVQCGEE